MALPVSLSMTSSESRHTLFTALFIALSLYAASQLPASQGSRLPSSGFRPAIRHSKLIHLPHSASGTRDQLTLVTGEGAGNKTKAFNSLIRSVNQARRLLTGSSLPDCTRACGPCMPCKIVTVSYKCEVGDSQQDLTRDPDSLACPSSYRCMCRGKAFPVP